MLAAALANAGELCVCDLSWISERAANLVSHHLRALRAQDLVRSRREGKLVIYALSADGRALVDAVLRLGPDARPQNARSLSVEAGT